MGFCFFFKYGYVFGFAFNFWVIHAVERERERERERAEFGKCWRENKAKVCFVRYLMANSPSQEMFVDLKLFA